MSTGNSRAGRDKIFRFAALNGGINLKDAEINLKDSESPEIVNLWWDDGGLQSRPGQEEIASGWGDGNSHSDFQESEIVYAAAAFRDGILVHVGAYLYAWTADASELRRVCDDPIPEYPGTFFPFGDGFLYKNRGGFYRLAYNLGHADNEPPFTVTPMQQNAFIPTIIQDADPSTGKGTKYQPENRLSAKKRVTYKPTSHESSVILTADGFKRAYSLDVTEYENLRGVRAVYLNEKNLNQDLYAVDLQSGVVIFNAAPEENAVLTFSIDIGNSAYHLPEESVDGVDLVKIDGLALTAGADYDLDAVAGIVTFTEAPPVESRVEITYSKANPKALSELLNVPYLDAFGNGILLAGGGSRLYWSGYADSLPDASYWPVDSTQSVNGVLSGFGKQSGKMIAFQINNIGILNLSEKNDGGYRRVTLSHSNLNADIGCDAPRSIRLIRNALTFADASGAYRIRSDGVERVSEKIDGSDTRPGLLYDFRVSGAADALAFDDGQRYWLAVNGHIWLWDYALSDDSDPVWFYFTGVFPRALCHWNGATYLVSRDAKIVRLGPVYNDFGDGIRKVYQLPARNFGSYDRLKNIRSVMFTLRDDTPSDTKIIYQTDYETRADPIPLRVAGYDRLSGRDLETRDLSVPRHAAAFRRKPKCNHVRHFSCRLESDDAGYDLSVQSVEIQIRYEGRDRACPN